MTRFMTTACHLATGWRVDMRGLLASVHHQRRRIRSWICCIGEVGISEYIKQVVKKIVLVEVLVATMARIADLVSAIYLDTI
jgi:adenosyl cobinamide kinase/adenosyl cobinamide phosphate guanylyltransferase